MVSPFLQDALHVRELLNNCSMFREPKPKTSCPFKKGISEVVDEYIEIQPYR
jgi:hypothetical protein